MNRTPSRAIELDLPTCPEAPAIARAAINGLCQNLNLPESQLESLRLLVSELVTNAVKHSEAPSEATIGLRICLRAEGVRVAVIDQGHGFIPGPCDPPHSGGGYGLYLVKRIAARWGVDEANGTRVWFELPLNASSSSPAGSKRLARGDRWEAGR
ncbi:MAG: ATP-binding protein [Solirubrobacteraceae bacterium]